MGGATLLLFFPGDGSTPPPPPPPPDIRAAVYAALVADAAVAAIVGTRVYPVFLPQTGREPCIVFTVISDVRVRGLAGTLGAAEARVQFDLRAMRLADAVALKEALRAKWEGYRGTMQNLEILSAWPVSEHDFARDPQDASDGRPVIVEVDYILKYRQSLISPTG